MSSGWIYCFSSDNHFSHHSTILFYINIFWLKHKSFDFIASISYFYLIIVFLPNPCWPPGPHLGSCHFLVLARLLYPPVSFLCGINKLFNFFKALFTTAGIFRLSMLLFKSPAIILTICRIVSVTNPSVSSRDS